MKPAFVTTTGVSGSIWIYWNGTRWQIEERTSDSTSSPTGGVVNLFYRTNADTTYPWQPTDWISDDGSDPAPTTSSFELIGEDILPYYDVVYLKPGSTDFETDGDLFISSLNYEMKFNIKLDAWTS